MIETVPGSFRPNQAKLLELLGGLELYNDPVAAFREALQNAMDAVRDSIARERLAGGTPLAPETIGQIAVRHKIDVVFNPTAATLEIRDNGSGMDLNTVLNYFLVSGRADRDDLRELEQRCNQQGFSTERSGQFGIGVLSYFMIANRIELRTRSDADKRGILLHSDGVNAKGQISRIDIPERGTTLTLFLKKEYAKTEFQKQLVHFLEMEIAYTPCRISYHIGTRTAETIETGWNPVRLSLLLADTDRFSYLEYKDDDEAAAIVSQMAACLDSIVSVGELGERLGRYRIILPYFKLLGRVGSSEELFPCRAYFRREESGAMVSVLPFFYPRIYWKGIGLGGRDHDEDYNFFFHSHGVLVQFDLYDGNSVTINVARNRCSISKEAEAIIEQLETEILALGSRFQEMQGDSPYREINARLYDHRTKYDKEYRDLLYQKPNDSFSWFYQKSGSETWNVGPVPYPMGWADIQYGESARLTWTGKELHWPVRIPVFQYSIDPVEILTPDCVMPLWINDSRRMAWLRTTADKPFDTGMGPGVHVPPEWRELCHISMEPFSTAMSYSRFHQSLWNRENPLVRATTHEAGAWVRELRFESLYKAGALGKAESRSDFAAAWFMAILAHASFYTRSSVNSLEPLITQEPCLLRKLWELAFTGESEAPDRVLSFRHLLSLEDYAVAILTPDKGFQSYRGHKRVARYLPDPEDRENWWVLAEEYQREFD